MDPRYRDSKIAWLWSPDLQYRHWLEIEKQTIEAQGALGIIPLEAAQLLSGQLSQILVIDAGLIQRIEQTTKHDVAAFLEWVHRRINDPGVSRWLHFGLTSSDLVDTAAAMRARAAYQHVTTQADSLFNALVVGGTACVRTPMLGRTHGQPAEPTSLGLRYGQWHAGLRRAFHRLDEATSELLLAKLSGPVGTYAHNPPQVERRVAKALGLSPARWCSATQVVPRDLLEDWAQSAAAVVAACARIATDFRLMAARGEVSEAFSGGQVGSSAMPHKRNPITAEQICGLDRLARGYAQMLQPINLWEDRDLSHSCVERVAVPDLWHTLCHAIRQTAALLEGAQWDTERIAANLEGSGRLPYTAWATLRGVERGLSRQDAEKAAVQWARGKDGADLAVPAPESMLANHPLAQD